MARDDASPEAISSVTTWLQRLKEGDSLSAQQLWQCYLDRLARLARRKLGDAQRRVADEEDVALSAFHGFLHGVEQGRFARLEDRHDLWQVLVMLTERKAIGQKRRLGALKRGGRLAQGQSAFDHRHDDGSYLPGISQVADGQPTPQFAAEAHEQLQVLLDRLGDDQLRDIAALKLESHTNEEIGRRLGLSLRAVERKLNLIRRKWLEAPP